MNRQTTDHLRVAGPSSDTNKLRRAVLIATAVFGAAVQVAAPLDARADAPAAVASVSVASPTATAEQRALETLTLKLAKYPEVQQAKAEARKLFLADPTVEIPAGKATLDGALDELVYHTIGAVANSDTSQPRIQWVVIADHDWFGLKVPGDRFGLDNPDNIYRNISIDGESKYKITGKLAGAPGVQYSFLVYGSPPDDSAKLSSVDTPTAGLLNTDLKTEADGSFVITVDGEPANGRVNHLQTNRYADTILLRDTLGDWTKQTPSTVRIERIGGPALKPISEKELAKRAAAKIPKDAAYWLKFNSGYIYQLPANRFATPIARGGGWGFMAQGHFDLQDDEALLVTVDSLGAKYIGFQIGDPWLRSREYRSQSSSLNNTQARPNSDGSYTYVIAARDPGIYNWLDTDGLAQGSMLIRWQALAKKVDKAEGVIKQLQRVKIADLNRLLPKDVARATADERKAQLATRLASYQTRLQTP